MSVKGARERGRNVADVASTVHDELLAEIRDALIDLVNAVRHLTVAIAMGEEGEEED